MDALNNQLKDVLMSLGASDVGFANTPDGVGGLNTAISIVVKLSDSVVDEIDDAPTHTYFHHYRTVNAFLDRIALQCGMYLEEKGHRYIPIAASQSINTIGNEPFSGRYSHKKAAYFAGLGIVGKNNLFLHKKFGPRVRLATVFTDAPLVCGAPEHTDICSRCNRCVKSCPAMALSGKEWYPGIDRSEIFDPKACSDYMKKHFKDIGRGVVCGICMKECKRSIFL